MTHKDEPAVEEPMASGIDAVGSVSWGTHLCLFYKTTEDLTDILVPYFKSGLENNEFCMWVTSDPLTVEDARAALSAAVPDLDARFESHQMEIVPYTEWYMKGGYFDMERVFSGWIGKLEDALARGFEGLRATGNTAWLEENNWDDFVQYEEKLNSIIGDYRMMAICTYSLDSCSAREVIDVCSNHQFSLIRQAGTWELVESSGLKETRQALEEGNRKYRLLVDNLNEGIWMIDTEARTTFANDKLAEMFGYTVEEMMGEPLFSFMDEEGVKRAEGLFDRRKEGIAEHHDFEFIKKDGSRLYTSLTTSPITDDEGNFMGAIAGLTDSSNHRKLEEALSASEQHYRLLVENANEVILTTDLDLKVTYASPSLERQTGFTVEEVVGHDTREFITRESSVAIAKVLAEQLTRQSKTDVTPPMPVMTEVEQFRKDGSTYPAEISAGFLRNDEGTPYGILVVSRDITEKREAEEALRQSEEHYRLLYDNAGEAIISHDSELILTDINRIGCELIGYSKEELVGRNILELGILHPDDVENAANTIRRHFDGEDVTEAEYTLIRKDGAERLSTVTGAAIRDPDGNLQSITVICRDITDRKQAEDDLQRVNSELEGYAHTASHDLKGPIGAVSLVFEMLNSAIEKGEVPQEKAERLKEMIEAGQKNTSNANNLIENLLVLAEAGEPRDVSTVSIEETIDRVLEENAEMIKEKGITVGVVSPLGTVVANPTHMYQLFSNLIRNSIKHGESENLVIEISNLGVDGTTHRFLVRDNGQGIPEEVLDDVFAPFVKGEKGGTGIGLSIVEKIVKAYGGDIRAYNDSGACFEFKLRDFDEVGH